MSFEEVSLASSRIRADMSLNEALESILPHGEKFETIHLLSPSIECHPLVTKQLHLSDGQPSLTVKSQHFFVLFHGGKAVFGLEIYVYLSLGTVKTSVYDGSRTIFVSKADTTGYANCKVNYRNVTKAVIQHILSIDPNTYLQKVIPKQRVYDNIDSTLITKKTSSIKALRILSKRTVSSESLRQQLQAQFYHSYCCEPCLTTKLCLFTRPASQYLFPESSKNPKKHIIDGDKLLKWWLSILDEIALESFQAETKATLRIPGEDIASIRRYLRNVKYGGWKVGDIFGDGSKDLAVYHVPLFPDDPKARFLRQLVEENRAHKTTLETFWIELQNRQEFKLSVTVSVIGLQGQPTVTSPQQKPFSEVVLSSSRKEFTALKKYVTGEMYDTAAGAEEAFSNVRDYLRIRLNRELNTIVGRHLTKRGSNSVDPDPENPKITATTLQPRKKPKKVLL